jgi:hypothetical protein
MDERKLSTRDIAGSAADAEREARPQVSYESGGAARATEAERSEPLFPAEEAQGYRSRWDAIQTGFVDEPRKAVEEADNLVADVMKRLASAFADERSGLEGQWSKGDQVSTEDLRVALRRYRGFFQRLLDI